MFPLTFLNSLKSLKIPEERALDLFHRYSEVHSRATNAENYNTTLLEENKRLKYENEFMLKLIDRHLEIFKDGD